MTDEDKKALAGIVERNGFSKTYEELYNAAGEQLKTIEKMDDILKDIQGMLKI